MQEEELDEETADTQQDEEVKNIWKLPVYLLAIFFNVQTNKKIYLNTVYINQNGSPATVQWDMNK